MGKKVLRALLFLAGFVILFACFNHLMAPKNTTEEAGMHEAHAKGFLAEPPHSLDAVILGNSLAFRGVTPLTIWEEYGITVYSCGTNDQILYQSEDYLRRVFENQSPRIVLLESDIIFRDHNTLDVIPHEAEELFPLIRYHDRWKNLHLSDFTQPIHFDTTDQGKGYIYIGYSHPMEPNDYMAPSDDVESVPGKSIRHLQNILALCQQHEAQLVIFSAPSIMGWSYARHNAMAELAQQLDVAFIDMNLMPEEVPIDWQTDAMDDGNHLNYYGAQKVSEYLGKYLSETNLFTDKRTQPEYAPWHDALADFYDTNEIKPNS